MMNAARQTRPPHPYVPVTAAWRERVIAELTRLGKSQEWLAEQVDTTSGAISNLLGGRCRTSRLVLPIVDLLAIPTPEFRDERDREFVRIGRALREKHPMTWDRYLEMMRRELADPKAKNDDH